MYNSGGDKNLDVDTVDERPPLLQISFYLPLFKLDPPDLSLSPLSPLFGALTTLHNNFYIYPRSRRPSSSGQIFFSLNIHFLSVFRVGYLNNFIPFFFFFFNNFI